MSDDRRERLAKRLAAPSAVDRTPSSADGVPRTVDPVKTQARWEETHHRATFWLADDLREAVREAAEAEGLSLRVWVDRAFRQALERGSGQ